MRASVRLAAATAVALLLSACGGSSSTPVAPIRPVALPVPVTTPGAASAATAAFVYDEGFVNRAQLVGPAALGRFGVDVVLRMRDAHGLIAAAQAASDPKSASYRHFYTPQQIADRFGATAADQQAAIAYFHTYGLWASGWKQRMLLRVAGTQAHLEAAFHTKFGQYRSPQGELFIAPESLPSVGAGVPVIGSANIVLRTKRFTRQFVTSKGVGVGYAPQQIAAAFDFNGAYAAGFTGSGITIGIAGTGPVVTSQAGQVGDADAYRALYKVPGASTVTLVPTTGSDPVVNGASGFSQPPPVTMAGCTGTNNPTAPGLPYSEQPTPTCNPEDGEAQLDTEQAAMLARDANVEFYLAYNPNDGCSVPNGSACPAGSGVALQGLAESDEELQTIIDHNSADVVSLSYGGSEPSEVGSSSPPAPFTADGGGLDPTEFAAMVAEGMAVFVASGDSGAYTCQQTGPANMLDSLCVTYPASDPNVTGVGGVTLPLTTSGAIAGPITAWGVQTSGGLEAGTGGGISAYFGLPAYQQGAAGVSGSMRNVPDLALLGDPATGVSALAYADPSFKGPQLFVVGGTSVAAPQMAAMWALVLQACKQNAACSSKGSGAVKYRLGNPNPLLYGIYGSTSSYAATFLPVLYGNNSIVTYCSNPNNAANCPSPAPGATATPAVPPLDPGYNANPNGGYNQLTGLGVPFGRALVRAVVGT